MPSERTWHKGPPPHIGWWNASRHRDSRLWRWWDGCVWSTACDRRESAKRAAAFAANWSGEDDSIEWSDYYPENARVPRIDPHKEHSNAQ